MHFILEFYSVFFKNIKRKILWYVLVYLLLHKYCDKEFKIMFVPSLVLEIVSSNPAERYMAEYSNLKVNAEMHIETTVCNMIP